MVSRRLRGLLVVSLACGACGGGDATPDAAPPAVDIDNGSCGDQLRFTGEYVDWDTDAAFCGINDALFEVRGGGAMDNTAPNGRFDLCIARGAATTVLDITPPTAASSCTTPASTYSLPGIAIASPAVILAGAAWSGRNFTVDRQASLGVTLDPAKAHVVVHVEGTPKQVTLGAAHDAPQAVVATTWAPGATGHEVFFPNVTLAATTTITVEGGAIGPTSIPLVAGTITNVTLLAR